MKIKKLSLEVKKRALILSSVPLDYDIFDDIKLLQNAKNKKNVDFNDINNTVNAMFRLICLSKGIQCKLKKILKD